jgi:abhydrolase domain-containing protein 17
VRRVIGFLGTLLIAWLALTAFAFLAADRLMFLPPASSYDARSLPVTHVETEDGAHIAVLLLPNDDARFTVVYSHGNAEDLGHLVPALEALRDAGFAVIAYDYRGYGASTGGPPTAHGAERDIEAVYRFATQTLGIAPGDIVLYGRSVGSGPATSLAAREQVGGLILEGAFTSAFVVVTRVRILPFDRFRNIAHIRDVNAPVLIVHGTRDEVIPVAHGRRLYHAANEPKQAFWVDGARHNDLTWVAAERYTDALRRFEALLEATHD